MRPTNMHVCCLETIKNVKSKGTIALCLQTYHPIFINFLLFWSFDKFYKKLLFS